MKELVRKFFSGLLSLWIFLATVAFSVAIATFLIVYLTGGIKDEQLIMAVNVLRGKKYYEDSPEEAELRRRIEELREKIRQADEARARLDMDIEKQRANVKSLLAELDDKLEGIRKREEALVVEKEAFKDYMKKEHERIEGYKETLEFISTLPVEAAVEVLFERPNTYQGNTEVADILIRIKDVVDEEDYIKRLVTAMMAKNSKRTVTVLDMLIDRKILKKER